MIPERAPHSSYSTYRTAPERPTLDLLALPAVGRFLRWRRSRAFLQALLLLLAAAIVLDGLLGPSLSPKNLATVITWVHYRGALVLVLLIAGNFFCMACPFMLPRELARRFIRPSFPWPRFLRNKWLSLALFVLILFAYELFDLWASPWWTTWLILAYFAGALVVDAFFQGASFCKFVCPIGQFNFVASAMSPLEVKVRNLSTCDTCRTKDCIRGRRDPADGKKVLQRGCELALFQPLKVGNMDCTFCLDCVYACPHDNIGISTRVPASELWDDPPRSGIGRFSRRPDLAVLAALFTFGALLNAFGMVSPVYAVQAWLAHALGTRREAIVLGLLFVISLVLIPALLLAAAAWLARRWSGTREELGRIATRYAYSLVPLGFGVWLAHYSFHFLTGFWTFVPVAQKALLDLGFSWAGPPRWELGGMPAASVHPLELGFLSLGMFGSLLVAFRIAERDDPSRPWPAFIPWAALPVLLWLAAIWLLSQPMEMRATFLGG